jgi:hypothetical protein
MKKRSSSRQNPKPVAKRKRAQQSVTIGMDLGIWETKTVVTAY